MITDSNSPYGHLSNAIMADSEMEHYEDEMKSLPVDIRDGDDKIIIEESDNVNVTDLSEGEEFEVDSIDIDTETGEVSEDDDEPDGDEDLELADVDSADLMTVGSELKEAMEGQQTLINEAIEKGLEPALVDSLKSEYETSGKLTEASYEALGDLGYSKTFIDSFIRGQEAITTKFVNSMKDYAGGKETFVKISEFISNDETMTNAFNTAIDRNDAATLKVLMDSAKTSLRQSFGIKPKRDLTKGAKPSGITKVSKVQPFASRGEMVKAMSDRRYQTDATYRQEVETRVALSF